MEKTKMGQTETEVMGILDGKVKPHGIKESRQRYLKRLLTGLDNLYGDDVEGGEENWEKANDAVQSWYKAAVKADEDKEELPEFKDAASTDEDAKPSKTTAPAKNGAASKKIPAARKKTTAAAAPKKARGGAKSGKISKIMAICYANPDKNAADVAELLAKKGIETKEATVWNVRTGMTRTCAFLHSEGLLKTNPFAATE